MRRICRSWTCLILPGWLAFCLSARAGEMLALRLKPENGGKFCYTCELRNVGTLPVEILAFNTFEVIPWQFDYRTKGHPGIAESRKRDTKPYVILEATSASLDRS